ncbi:MAG TPA: sodium-independent anion transporter, partial [bacterium]|nr:sodium-independent anion transporter [bacterium]
MFQFFNKQLIIQLQKDFQSKRLVPYITTGLVIGIINILTLISYGALIFSGSLSEYVSSGIGLMLFGAFVIGLFTALTSSYEGTIALPQDIP